MKSYQHTLSGVFYAPKFDDVFTLTSAAIESKKNVLSWKDPNWLWLYPEDVAGALVMLHYSDYCDHDYIWDKGKMNLRRLIEVCKEVAGFIRMNECMNNPKSYGLDRYISDIDIEPDINTIGYGTLTEEYKSSDNDPYETAGGYRKYVAEAGTKVSFILDDYNRLYAFIKSSLIIDHYNNNFYGVSTGGGTKVYNVGEFIVNRSLMIGYDITHIKDILAVDNLMFDFKKAGIITKNNIEKLSANKSVVKQSVI